MKRIGHNRTPLGLLKLYPKQSDLQLEDIKVSVLSRGWKWFSVFNIRKNTQNWIYSFVEGYRTPFLQTLTLRS